ncbi:hypothetical protein [Acinetobacter baumannii]|uniref:hypothetical protein n=1 Tax=Acinetobacter baumannii TaxID=470 RepID=UPI0022DDC754|nr:hypothetical protein [Acinetobacter baumannii]MDA0615418.1 hypothetical protein [Acinetobacter baumannii]
MYKTLTTCLLVTCLGLSGCATSILSTALPNETTEVQTTILKTDQIIVLGQAIKNPFKRVTRMALYPLAMAFDIVTVAPSLILSDLRGDFTK